MRRITSWTIGLAMALLSACGGGGAPTAQGSADTPSPVGTTATPAATSPSPTPTAACSPKGSEVHVVAKGVDFDTDCLAVPADTAFTIEFKNEDAGIQHNINLEGNGEFFVGDLVRGVDDTTYHVDPFPSGIYTFYCKIHPSEMNGQFVVA